ncbi:hypothetical protein PCE1_004493 [Barthelona sp. PCE]
MSNILIPFRQMGAVCEGVKPAVAELGQELFITVSVGNTWQTYSSENLRVMGLGCEHQYPVECLEVFREVVFSSCGNQLYAFHKKFGKKQLKVSSSSIRQLLRLGDVLFVLHDNMDLLLFEVHDVFRTEDITPFKTVTLAEFGLDVLEMIHPPSYVNKLVLRTKDSVVIYNFNINVVIHTFDMEVTGFWLTEHPDVLAFANEDHQLRFMNIKFGETLFEFQLNARITSACYDTSGRSSFFVGLETGDIVMLNLEDQLVVSKTNCHEGTVVALVFFHTRSLLVSISDDNSIKEFLLESQSNFPRLYRSRIGQCSPLQTVSFLQHDDPTRVITSDGSGRIVSQSTHRDHQVFAFSTRLDKKTHVAAIGKTAKLHSEFKVPPARHIAPLHLQHKRWRNIASIHYGEDADKVLFWAHERNGRLDQNHIISSDESRYTAIAFSNAGTQLVAATESGLVDVYDPESLLKRCSFNVNESVVAVDVDIHDAFLFVVTVSTLYKFSLVEEVLFASHSLGAVSCAAFNKARSLLTVGTEFGSVQVFSLKKWCSVREFEPCFDSNTPFTAITFMEVKNHLYKNSVFVLAAGMDRTMRIYDVISNCCVDALRFDTDSTCTGLSVSSDGQYIVTIHTNSHYAYLWTNQMSYRGVALQRCTEPRDVQLPSHPAFDSKAADLDFDNMNTVLDFKGQAERGKIKDGLLHFSGNDKISHVVDTVINLSDRQEKVETETNTQLPFFLKTDLRTGRIDEEATKQANDMVEVEEEDEWITVSDLLRLVRQSGLTQLKIEELSELEIGSDVVPVEVISYIKKMTPARIDSFVHEMSTTKDGAEDDSQLIDHLKLFIALIATQVTHVELYLTITAHWFKAHSMNVYETEEVHDLVRVLNDKLALHRSSLTERVREITASITSIVF